MAKIMLNGIDYSAATAGINMPYSEDDPKPNGVASAGTSEEVSRSDHVHPEQQSVPGNAGTVGGFSASTMGERGCIPVIKQDGVLEVGKYIDFHAEDTQETKDFDVRITAEEGGISITGTTTGTFRGNLEGNATTADTAGWANGANTANNAIVSAGLANSGNLGYSPMTFYWSGQGGQPTWLWGGDDGVSMYVYNPANFSVNYANSAGYANSSGVANSVAYENVSGRPTFLLSGTTLYINF